jgi:hypothetical protein
MPSIHFHRISIPPFFEEGKPIALFASPSHSQLDHQIFFIYYFTPVFSLIEESLSPYWADEKDSKGQKSTTFVPPARENLHHLDSHLVYKKWAEEKTDGLAYLHF